MGAIAGVLVEPDMEGFILKIHDKIAKRAMEKVNIRLENVRLCQKSTAFKVEHFKQVGQQLLAGRIAVARKFGSAMGVYEAAFSYVQRTQFGKPIWFSADSGKLGQHA